MSYSGGTHSSKSAWVDSIKSSSSAAESEAIIEAGGNKKEEDAGSIKGDENLEMKIITLTEQADDQNDKDNEKPTTTTFGI